MRAIVLFDTLYGNTGALARQLAAGLKAAGVEAECVNTNKMGNISTLSGYDLIVLGAPTQFLTASKPMKQFLSRLKGMGLRGKYGFAFDTKLGSPLSGSAAKFIEKKLRELGLQVIRSRESAIVVSQKEPVRPGHVMLKSGSEEAFEKLGEELGSLLTDPAFRSEHLTT